MTFHERNPSIFVRALELWLMGLRYHHAGAMQWWCRALALLSGAEKSSHGRHGQRLEETASAPKCFEVAWIVAECIGFIWIFISERRQLLRGWRWRTGCSRLTGNRIITYYHTLCWGPHCLWLGNDWLGYLLHVASISWPWASVTREILTQRHDLVI